MQETPLSRVALQPKRWACVGHWPPGQIESDSYFRHPDCRLPGRLFPFEGCSLAYARAGYPVLLSSLCVLQRPIHHWR